MIARVGLFAVAAMLAGGVFAQTTFTSLDTDGDGRISRQEAEGSELAQNFRQADTDGNARVTETEFYMYQAEQDLQAERVERQAGPEGGG